MENLGAILGPLLAIGLVGLLSTGDAGPPSWTTETLGGALSGLRSSC